MRLVLNRYATWNEIAKMDIDDVDLQNIALDEWERAENQAHENAESGREVAEWEA